MTGSTDPAPAVERAEGAPAVERAEGETKRADPAEWFTGEREMLLRDRASAMLGMVVELDEPGHAVVSMRVRDDMTNGFAITHGGIVFSLADTAFAMACNVGEAVTVSAGGDIAFLASTRAGQTLTADARLRAASGRTGVYDVTVTDEAGTVVAEFRGRSVTTRSTLT